MKLWTTHPSGFPVDTITEIDPTNSFWWTYDDPGFRYREVLPILCDLVGTKNFLWCCTAQEDFLRTPEQNDLVEWELNIPRSSVLAFYDEIVWDKIVRGKSDEWTALILNEVTEPYPKHVSAMVRVPLPPNSATCLGPSSPVKIYDSDGKLLHF